MMVPVRPSPPHLPPLPVLSASLPGGHRVVQRGRFPALPTRPHHVSLTPTRPSAQLVCFFLRDLEGQHCLPVSSLLAPAHTRIPCSPSSTHRVLLAPPHHVLS